MAELKFQGDILEGVNLSREIVSIVRSGQLEAKKKEVIDHGLWACGQFNAAFMPDDGPPVIGSPLLTAEECCDALEAALPEVHEGQLVVQGATDWGLIISLILQLLDMLKKKNAGPEPA